MISRSPVEFIYLDDDFRQSLGISSSIRAVAVISPERFVDKEAEPVNTSSALKEELGTVLIL